MLEGTLRVHKNFVSINLLIITDDSKIWSFLLYETNICPVPSAVCSDSLQMAYQLRDSGVNMETLSKKMIHYVCLG